MTLTSISELEALKIPRYSSQVLMKCQKQSAESMARGVWAARFASDNPGVIRVSMSPSPSPAQYSFLSSSSAR